MAQSGSAFDFGASALVEPMMQVFNGGFFNQDAGASGFPGAGFPGAAFTGAAFPGAELFGADVPGSRFFGAEGFEFDPTAMLRPGEGREPENPFEAWLSMFPTAPMFGVKWAFWPMFAPFAPEASTSAPEATGRERAAHEREVLSLPEGVRAPAPAKAEAKAETPVNNPVENKVVHLPTRSKPAAPASMPETLSSAAETRKAEKAMHEDEKRKLAGPAAKPTTAKAAAKPAAAKTTAEKPAPKKAAKTPTKAPAKAPAKPRAKKARGADGRPGNLLTSAPKKVDDLKKIKGVGAKLEMVLNDLGIYQYKQIAEFDAQDYAWLDTRLGAFKGRGVRDGWSDQATALIKG